MPFCPTPCTAELFIIFPTMSSMWSRSLLSWQTVSSHSWKQGWQWSHVGKMPMKPRAHSSHCFPSIPSLHSHFPVTLSHWAISEPSRWQLHSKCMRREEEEDEGVEDVTRKKQQRTLQCFTFQNLVFLWHMTTYLCIAFEDIGLFSHLSPIVVFPSFIPCLTFITDMVLIEISISRRLWK